MEISPAQPPLDIITCHLRTVSLRDKPEYEALSYVWGGSSDNRQILLDGNELSVTNSLFEALAHLRDVKKERILWVDALCINQKDDIEKSIQVMMMDRIYAQASTVLVWLLNSKSPELLDDIISRSQNPERHFTEFPLSLLALSKISWWHRAWTFQEAALAKNLIFYAGYQHFSLEDLWGYFKSLFRHLFQSNQCCRAVLYAAEPVNKLPTYGFTLAFVVVRELLLSRRIISQGKQRLLDLIVSNRDRKATKPQDKVYAYLGLAYDVPTEFVKYELSAREWILYISTKFIQHNKSLEIVRYASPSGFSIVDKHRMDGLPSWSPDWTQSMESDFSFLTNERYKHLSYRRFAASRQTKANPCFPTPEILGVTGIVCDTVTHVGCDSSCVSGAGADPQTLRQWSHVAAHNTSIHHAKCDECDKIIYGIRHKCCACPDFDLCSRCFNKSTDIHPDHLFTSIRSRTLESQYNRCSQCKRTKSLSLLEESSPMIDLYKQPDIVETKLENDIVKTSDWEWLSEIAYPFNDGDTLQDAFRKTLTADMIQRISLLHEDIESREASIFLKIAFAKFWHLRIENRLEATLNLEEGYTMEPGGLASRALDEKSIKTVASLVRMVAWEVRFFVSSKGYIGWGPRTMMPGDTVAVLHGGDMPFVLREVPEQLSKTNIGSGYTVIGECYVHGLMRGEALDNEEMEKCDFLLY